MNNYWVLISILLVISGCSGVEKQTDQIFDQYVKNINVEQIGNNTAELDINEVSKGTYKIDARVSINEETIQKGWAISIHPTFESTFCWAPHLTPTKDHIISDHVFRAPALVWSSSEKIITLIPDLETRNNSSNRWYMDLDIPNNKLVVGMSDYVVEEHVLFKKADSTKFGKGEVELSFYLILSDDKEAIENPWRKPLEFMWEKYGKSLAEKGEPLNGEIEPFVKHTYNWAFNSWKDAIWQEFNLNGKRVGAPVFIVNYTQSPNYPGQVDEREFRSIWNQAWFNSLRSAQGLYRYGRRVKNDEYIKKARMTKELALSFPQKGGLFPGLIATEMEQVDIEGKAYSRSKGWGTYYFGNSNRNPSTYNARTSPLHILDMSCTAFFMLKWYEELEKDERLLHYAKEYGYGLLKYQDTQGFFPAWISEETMKPMDILAQSPETSKSVTFLLKLSELTGDIRFKDAALKAMDAVIQEIIPTGRWEDFETYWSCSRWGSEDYVGKKIQRNDMYKQNTLSIYWTAEALLDCYELTKDEKYLKLGQRTLDELLMAQAVWQPPYMYVNVFGGFGVMNADGEWNDSRQALFSELIIRYGKLLQNDEYVQRGIAALKASFSMMYCPENPKTKNQWEQVYPFFNEKDYGFMMENYGHNGYTDNEGGGIGVFTIYDWGNGAASEAYSKIVDYYGIDIFAIKKE